MATDLAKYMTTEEAYRYLKKEEEDILLTLRATRAETIAIRVTDPRYPPGTQVPQGSSLFLLELTFGKLTDVRFPIGWYATEVAKSAWKQGKSFTKRRGSSPDAPEYGAAILTKDFVVAACSGIEVSFDAGFCSFLAEGLEKLQQEKNS